MFRFVPLGTELPHVATAIDLYGAQLDDLSWTGAGQPLEFHHVSDDGRQVGQSGDHHIVSNGSNLGPFSSPGFPLRNPSTQARRWYVSAGTNS